MCQLHPTKLDPIHLVKSLQKVQSSQNEATEHPDNTLFDRDSPSRLFLEDFSDRRCRVVRFWEVACLQRSWEFGRFWQLLHEQGQRSNLRNWNLRPGNSYRTGLGYIFIINRAGEWVRVFWRWRLSVCLYCSKASNFRVIELFATGFPGETDSTLWPQRSFYFLYHSFCSFICTFLNIHTRTDQNTITVFSIHAFAVCANGQNHWKIYVISL